MASNIDASLAGTTVTVSGSAIVISSLSEVERAILTVALAALAATRAEGISAGKAIGCRFGRSTGAVENVVITVGAG